MHQSTHRQRSRGLVASALAAGLAVSSLAVAAPALAEPSDGSPEAVSDLVELPAQRPTADGTPSSAPPRARAADARLPSALDPARPRAKVPSLDRLEPIVPAPRRAEPLNPSSSGSDLTAPLPLAELDLDIPLPVAPDLPQALALAPATPRPTGPGWAAEFRSHADDLIHHWHQAGDAVDPGQADWQTAEVAVHTWDLVRATGQAQPLIPEVAERGLAFMSANLTDENRGPAFGPAVPVPDDAPVYDRLAGFAGRKVDR